MPIVDTQTPITSESCNRMLVQLAQTYPFLRQEQLTATAFQRPIGALIIGTGPRKVLFTAAHHANEWITALILLKFAEDWAQAIVAGGTIGGVDANALAQAVRVHLVPMVDPDGVDLVVGDIAPDSPQYQLAQRISQDFPSIPFPEGWKANLLGTDLNLNYPAGWLTAREIKYMQGFVRPAPRDFVGTAPLNQQETRTLAEYTRRLDPELVLAYHTQGGEIYWQFKEYEVPGAQELGERMAQASGYALAEVAPNSAYAGYKDWFIQEFRRPGYTIEAGRGTNPLPLSQFPEIYRDNLPLLLIAAQGYQ